MNDFDRRIRVLRTVEPLCYTVCSCLLPEEKSAVIAAKQTLLDLFKDSRFWTLQEAERDKTVRQKAVLRVFEQLSQTETRRSS